VLHQRIDLRGNGKPAIHADSVEPVARLLRATTYWTVSTIVVLLVIAVTPLLDCPVTVTLNVPVGVSCGLLGPWL
jgi:hypothetical protein